MFISLAMGFGIMAVKEVQSPMAFALLNQSHLLLTLANCSQDTGPVPSKLWPMGQPDQKTPADSGSEETVSRAVIHCLGQVFTSLFS